MAKDGAKKDEIPYENVLEAMKSIRGKQLWDYKVEFYGWVYGTTTYNKGKVTDFSELPERQQFAIVNRLYDACEERIKKEDAAERREELSDLVSETPDPSQDPVSGGYGKVVALTNQMIEAGEIPDGYVGSAAEFAALWRRALPITGDHSLYQDNHVPRNVPAYEQGKLFE